MIFHNFAVIERTTAPNALRHRNRPPVEPPQKGGPEIQNHGHAAMRHCPLTSG